MTTNQKQLAVGLKRAIIYPLTADGLPAAVDENVYEGLEVVGPKAFTLTIPDARKISHLGNDRVLAIDYLPPTEGMSGELRVASNDIDVKAAISNVKVFAIGESDAMPWGTDQQGNELDAGMLLFQQSLDSITKSRRWKYYIIPKARLIPAPANMDENAAEDRYTIAPNPTSFHLWGTQMTFAEEGATEAGMIEGMSTGRPNIVAFVGDGTTVAFLLPVNKPAISDTALVAWVDGVEQTTGVTFTTTTATFSVAPALGEIVVVFYEY